MTSTKIIFPIIIILLIVFLYFANQYQSSQKNNSAEVCFLQSGKCFTVEVADTPAKQVQGLMFRKNLDEDKGMLFVFQKEEQQTFWMKNTLIPLDMLWINSQDEIVTIKTTQPCTTQQCELYSPSANAKYVLEINSGEAKKYNISEGQKVKINY